MPTTHKEYLKLLQRAPTSYIYPDWGIRWEPPSAQVPENVDYSFLTDTGATKLVIHHRTGRSYTVSGHAFLEEITFPLMESATGLITASNNPRLVTFSTPRLLTAVGGVVLTNNPGLTTLVVPGYLPTNGTTISFNGGALTAASVNAILARAVANAAYVSGTINTAGGTNAAPTGQGITDKATLIARGVTVTTN